MSRPLFEITDDLLKLNDLLDEVEGDVSRFGEMEPAITAYMDSLAGEEAAKLDAYVNLIRQLESEAAVAKAEAEQYAKKAKTRESRAAWLKERLKMHMEQTGQGKVDTERGRTVTIQRNGGKLPVTVNDSVDLNAIPLWCVKIVRSVDTDAVRSALERGEALDFARLGERGTHLRIK